MVDNDGTNEIGGLGLQATGEIEVKGGGTMKMVGPLTTSGANSKIEVNSGSKLQLANAATNTIGGKGLKLTGQCELSGGAVCRMEGPLSSTGEDAKFAVGKGCKLEISNNGDNECGGQGIEVEGEVSIGGGASMDFSGPFVAKGEDSLVSIAVGSIVKFSSKTGTSSIGGKGLDSKGTVQIESDVANSGTVTFGKVAVVADNYVQKEGATTMGGTTIKMNGNPMKIEGGSVDGAAGTLEGEVKLSGMAGLSP